MPEISDVVKPAFDFSDKPEHKRKILERTAFTVVLVFVAYMLWSQHVDDDKTKFDLLINQIEKNRQRIEFLENRLIDKYEKDNIDSQRERMKVDSLTLLNKQVLHELKKR